MKRENIDAKEIEKQAAKNWGQINREDKIEKAKGCLHLACPECHGTGVKKSGQICVHHISCPCPKCTPYFMSV